MVAGCYKVFSRKSDYLLKLVKLLAIYLWITIFLLIFLPFFILHRILNEWQNHALKTDNEKVQIRHNMRLQRYMSELEHDPVYRTVLLKTAYPCTSAFEVRLISQCSIIFRYKFF